MNSVTFLKYLHYNPKYSLMKKYILLLLTSLPLACTHGQGNEFQTYQNGLIYNEATMHRLGAIVDSLNVKFRSCDLAHPYYSFPQGFAYFVRVDSKEAQSQIKRGITLEDYRKKYNKAVSEKVWVMKYMYTDDEKRIIKYSALPHGGDNQSSITVDDNKANNVASGWVLEDNGKGAIFVEKLQHYTLPHEYARLVQYVDCMVDTSAQIFIEGSDYDWGAHEQGPKTNKYVEWALDFPNRPTYPDQNTLSDEEYGRVTENFWIDHAAWDSLRILDLDKRMQQDVYGQRLLNDATDEVVKSGASDEDIEFYIGRYGSKRTALQLKRSRRVMGTCSMDTSPRRHAMTICKLAAETASWDIFLRSHLDIMNDRFERTADGSYAWAGRKTYLKELELLDIDAIDLLVGTSLRVENVSDNHYWGSVGRVGRALADAGDKDQLEQRLLTMIGNSDLDPFNRLLTAYLLHNYAYNLDDETRKKQCTQKLEDSISKLPPYIAEIWNKK
jgi:hypothetical protein